MNFTPTTEEIQAEVDNLKQLGIVPYQTKHLVLCPLITKEKEVGGQKIQMSDKYVEEQQKDLHLFFFVVAPAINVQRGNVLSVGDSVFSAGSKRILTIPREQFAPVLDGAVYGLIEDYDCDLVKQRV